jgi:drug/metabolite transporter (DMT)-like permease
VNPGVLIGLVLAQLVWGASYVAMKWVLAELPVPVVVFLRLGFASLAFVVYWAFRKPPKFAPRDFLLIVGVGILDFFVGQTLQFAALKHTQAVDASILVMFEPLITVVLAAWMVRERPTRITWIALGFGMAGMVILSNPASVGGVGLTAARLFGNLLFLLALTCEGVFSASGKIFLRRYSPIHCIALMTLSAFAVGTVVNLPVIGSADYGAVSAKAWLSAAFLGLVCCAAGYTLWYWVIQRAPVQQAALSLFLQPVFGTVFATLLLGESVGFGTLVGAGLIVSSLAWWHLRS